MGPTREYFSMFSDHVIRGYITTIQGQCIAVKMGHCQQSVRERGVILSTENDDGYKLFV